jgi:hypothetical protein
MKLAGMGDLHGLQVKDIALHFGSEAQESTAARSSIRRALATIRSAGLVYWAWDSYSYGEPPTLI